MAVIAVVALSGCRTVQDVVSPRPRADVTTNSSSQPGQYQQNEHTLFYVDFENRYLSGGATYFPELGDGHTVQDPSKDCQVVEGGDYFSVVPGRFGGNALRVLGDFHKIFALFCHNSKLLTVGHGTPTQHYTVGFWVRTVESGFQGFRAFTVLYSQYSLAGGCTDPKLISLDVVPGSVGTYSECHGGTNSSASVADGQWHNVIVVYDHDNSVYPSTTPTGKLVIYID